MQALIKKSSPPDSPIWGSLVRFVGVLESSEADTYHDSVTIEEIGYNYLFPEQREELYRDWELLEVEVTVKKKPASIWDGQGKFGGI